MRRPLPKGAVLFLQRLFLSEMKFKFLLTPFNRLHLVLIISSNKGVIAQSLPAAILKTVNGDQEAYMINVLQNDSLDKIKFWGASEDGYISIKKN